MNKESKIHDSQTVNELKETQHSMCYIICSSPRTGSSLLAHALWKMGIGRPGEYLSPAVVKNKPVDWHDFMKPTPMAYIEKLKQTESVDGIFGFKTHYMDFARYPEIMENVTVLFPSAKYISLTRRNILRQAISRTRATQTMSWNANTHELKNAQFNYFAVLKNIIVLIYEIECWDNFFARNNITPLRLVYEDLEQDYEGTMHCIMAFLGVKGNIPPPALKKQSDTQTELWVNEFVHYLKRRRIIRAVVRRLSQHW